MEVSAIDKQYYFMLHRIQFQSAFLKGENAMSESVKQNVHYECPNSCPDTWFFQDGTSASTRKLTEDGEFLEDEHYDFTPTTSVKCCKCLADASVQTKMVRIITTIE